MKGVQQKAIPGCLPYAQTGSVFIALFTLGLVSGVLGPTLIDLSVIFQETVERTSQILTLRGFGVFAGSLLASSLLYRFINGKLCLVMGMIIGGIVNAGLPFVRNLYFAEGCTLTIGMCIGILETGGNVWLVQLWKEKVAPVFQMYHLSFGIGALISPVIAEPFLRVVQRDINGTIIEQISESRIQVPYTIFGSLYALVGVFMLALYFIEPSNIRQQTSNEDEMKNEKTEDKYFEFKIIGHLVVYILVLCATETTIHQMLSAYVVKNPLLHYDEHSASYLVATYWATFTIGRVSAIFLAFKISPYSILLFSITICFIGALILFLFGTSQSWALWPAIGILGFGLAPSYGAAMSWTVSYMKLRYHHMTFVLVASCAGQMAPALTVGLLISTNPNVFVYLISGYIVFHMMNVAVMYLTTRGHTRQNDVVKEDTIPAAAANHADTPNI